MQQTFARSAGSVMSAAPPALPDLLVLEAPPKVNIGIEAGRLVVVPRGGVATCQQMV